MRITVACPDWLMQKANHLAMVLAQGPDDILTYRAANWQGESGDMFAIASFVVAPAWIAMAQGALSVPEWDTGGVVDLDAATEAQALLSVNYAGVPADASKLTAILGLEPHEAVAAFGLHPLEV